MSSLVPSWPKKNSHWIPLADWSCECGWEEDSEAEWRLERWSPRGEEKVQYLWILSVVNPFTDWSCKWRERLWSRVTARTRRCQEDQGVKKKSNIYGLFQQILSVVNPFADWSCKWRERLWSRVTARTLESSPRRPGGEEKVQYLRIIPADIERS